MPESGSFTLVLTVICLSVLHTYIYEIYNALHSRAWLESEGEARAVARWRGLGGNGREVECF